MTDEPINVTPPSPSPGVPESPSARTLVVACHLSALSMYLTGLGHIVGPLIVWLLKKHEFGSVDWHGKAALNFQISVTLYGILITVLGILTCGWGFLLAVPLAVLQVVAVVLAAWNASEGRPFDYPLSIRFIS